MGQKTLLGTCQEFCRRLGLPAPSTVTGATDTQVLQMWGLLNEGQQDLGNRANTQMTVQPSRIAGTDSASLAPTFPHAGYGYNQLIAAALSENNTRTGGGISALSISCPMPGFKELVKDTLWETTSRIPVYGPLTEHEWVYVTTMSVQPTRYAFKLDSNFLYIYPYSATALFTCMYITRFSVVTGNTTNPDGLVVYFPNAPQFNTDYDFSILPDALVLADLKWRWRQMKGLPYAEDQRACEQMLANMLSNQPSPTVSMDGLNEAGYVVGPGLYVVAGSTIPP